MNTHVVSPPSLTRGRLERLFVYERMFSTDFKGYYSSVKSYSACFGKELFLSTKINVKYSAP